jgi:hypothetical protein
MKELFLFWGKLFNSIEEEIAGKLSLFDDDDKS